MEKKYPNLWKAFGNHKAEKVVVLPEYAHYSEEDILKMNILNKYQWISGNYSNVSISKVRDRMILNGEVDKNLWPGVTIDNFPITDGLYYVSAGFNHPEVFIYLEHWQDGTNDIVTSLLGNEIVKFDSKSSDDTAKLVIGLKKGIVLNNVIVRPIIIKIDKLINAPFFISAWYVNRGSWEDLSDKERVIVDRILKYQSGTERWTSVIFDDGNGIQIVEGVRREGQINMFGVVNE